MHQTADHRRRESPAVRTDARAWLTVVLLCAAQFMLILDITVVNVALPTIQADLGVALRDLQWVVTAYTLAFGGLILLGGRASDLFGGRRLFLAGLLLFTVASLAAALAPAAGVLIAARTAQGVGAALLSPAALALISTVFPPGPARHRALAAWAAVAASGGAVGVLVGGALTETLGWRAIFLVNLPVGAALAAAAPRLLPVRTPVARGRVDLTGALLATGSLAALIYGLAQVDTVGWGSARTLVPLATAAVGIAAFVRVERRTPHPLVSLSLFRRRPTAAALTLMVLGMGPVFAGFFFSSLYLQQVLGHSALRTGVEFLPVAVVIVATAHAGGHLMSRLGPRTVIAAGLATGAAGAFLLGGVSPDGGYHTDILPGFLLLGAGGGLAAAGVMVTAMSGAGSHDSGAVAGLTNAAHELSIALVLPVLSTVAASRIGGAAVSATVGTSTLTGGIGAAYRAAAVLALAGALVAILALRRGDVAPGTAAVMHGPPDLHQTATPTRPGRAAARPAQKSTPEGTTP